MGELRKPAKTGSPEKIFDRLTVIVLTQEMLRDGAYGPLSEQQKTVLADLLQRTREVADLFREITDR